MSENAIEVTGVSKVFKLNDQKGFKNLLKVTQQPKILLVLDEISFTVKKGEILGIIGSNGSGKTTLLRIISGIYKPTKGSVKVNGTLSPLMQLGAGFQDDLIARDNIMINGMLLGLSKSDIQEKIDPILTYAELKKFKNLKLKHYSAGMRARLSFSISLQLESDIMLIDEILSVGDKNFREKSYNSFLSFKKKHKTILHASHNLGKLAEFSDRILLIHKGKVLAIGPPLDVIKKYSEIKSSFN